MTTSYPKIFRAPTLLAALLVFFYVVAVPLVTYADSTSFASFAKTFTDNQAFVLSASENGTTLQDGATTTLKIGTLGSFSTSFSINPAYARNARLSNPGSLSGVLSNATLTLDLYKGVIGSSTLIYSQPVSSSSPPITFPVNFDSGGTYFLALSATYPDGTYPPGKAPQDICGGDFCILPRYWLTSFQNVMMHGNDLVETTGGLANSIPAAHGFLQFTIAPESKLVSNVLFIPGTMESRLYMRDGNNPEKEIWEPILDRDVSLLAMNPDGTSKHQIYTRDIMDYAYSHTPTLAQLVKFAIHDKSVMYAPFQKFMDDMVASNTLKEWRTYPYDWRYEVSDIVKDGTLVGNATGTPSRMYLAGMVQQLASTSPTGKVSIIAHSNGGLLAKALAIELQKQGKLNLLDRLILVGTPELGTPMSIGTMLHGDGQTQGNGFVTYGGTVRAASATMPGPYDLLPSSAYFDKVQTPVVSFANDTLDTPYRTHYAADIISSAKLVDFVTNVGNTRNAPTPRDLDTPTILSSAYMQKAQATHSTLDPWIPPASLPIVSIVGWGRPTPSQYLYSGQSPKWDCPLIKLLQLQCGKKTKLAHYATTTDDGDNTVVSPSAASIGQALYLDSKALAREKNISVVHQSLLSAAAIQSQISDVLQGVSTTESYMKTSQPSDGSNPLLVVSVHSPAVLIATDTHGNKTGLVTVEGLPDFYFFQQDIPGSRIETYGTDKYTYLPANQDYTFSVRGYEEGQTTIDVGVTDPSGNITNTQTFATIPTTASTTMTFAISNMVATAPAVDIYGTGKIDLIASSSDNNTPTSTVVAQLEKDLKSSGHYGLREWLAIMLWKISNGNDSSELHKVLNWIGNFFKPHGDHESVQEDAPTILESVAKIDL
jgi:pimeloyl-ACP methyl ester carboxylesterase